VRHRNACIEGRKLWVDQTRGSVANGTALCIHCWLHPSSAGLKWASESDWSATMTIYWASIIWIYIQCHIAVINYCQKFVTSKNVWLFALSLKGPVRAAVSLLCSQEQKCVGCLHAKSSSCLAHKCKTWSSFVTPHGTQVWQLSDCFMECIKEEYLQRGR